jgi:hypothetical protein
MYPGDTFNIDNPVFNSNYAVERFMNDYNSMVIDHTPEAKTQEEISEAIEKTFSDFNNKTIGILKKIIEPLTFYIHDLDLYLTVDIKNSKYVFSQNPIKYRYQICSQVCWFTFNFTWGGNTLQVSGMYIDRDFPEKNSEFFRIQNLLSTEYFSIKSFSKFKNSICFIWSKRFEIYYRIFNR